LSRSVAGLPPRVEFSQVTVRAGSGPPLLQDFSLSVAAGTLHALVGRNGAGKTTLLRALLGEVEFTGSIRIDRQRGGSIGYVPQRLEFDRTLALTVGEFLAATRQRRPVCLGVSAAARARVAAVLASVGLADAGQRPIAALSGGELRRVLLAHALEPRPELLLLDEATEGLDRAALARFEELVKTARAAGTTILLVSHDAALVARLADAVTSLDGEGPAP